MAMTNNEKSEAYRNRMYEAGYKQMRIWIPRDSEKEPIKTDRKMFLRRLEGLTAGWSKNKLSRFLSEVLVIVNNKIKEDK
jgi:hypothetical protein